MSPVPIAVYRRTVLASLARVRENVLDWEHLPWLHRTSFGHIRLLGTSDDGWRAETSLAGGGAPFVVEVAIDRPGRIYHSRTIEGPGAGSDIVTTLTARGERSTAIHVEFLIPGVAPEHRALVGPVYTELYARLWNEDEAMMVRRQTFLDGRLADTTREVAVAGVACRFSTVCPHLGGPLDQATVDDAGIVTCPWHGHRFDVRTGRRVDAAA